MQTDEFVKAAKDGDLDEMRRLFSAEPGVLASRGATGETALMGALYNRREAVVEWLVASGVPLDIFAAASLGDVAALAPLTASADAVASYSYDGWTPLHLAAFFGRRAAAEALLGAGAAIDAVSRNALANTPLHAAVAGGQVDVSLMLIEAGADIHAQDAGRHTPFHLAAEAGYVPIARALFDRGADAHVVDAEDRTPLSRAVAKGHAEIVDLINVAE